MVGEVVPRRPRVSCPAAAAFAAEAGRGMVSGVLSIHRPEKGPGPRLMVHRDPTTRSGSSPVALRCLQPARGGHRTQEGDEQGDRGVRRGRGGEGGLHSNGRVAPAAGCDINSSVPTSTHPPQSPSSGTPFLTASLTLSFSGIFPQKISLSNVKGMVLTICP